MKNILFISFILFASLFAVSCMKSDEFPEPVPEPLPEATVYKAEIALTFDIPDGMTLSESSRMWIEDSNGSHITYSFQAESPAQIIILEGDNFPMARLDIEDYVGKDCLLVCSFTKIAEGISYVYDDSIPFTMENGQVAICISLF